jgi:predicted ATPase
LTGPGNTGKTRLTVAVAEQMTRDISEVATVVSLAPLHDVAFVASADAE